MATRCLEGNEIFGIRRKVIEGEIGRGWNFRLERVCERRDETSSRNLLKKKKRISMHSGISHRYRVQKVSRNFLISLFSLCRGWNVVVRVNFTLEYRRSFRYTYNALQSSAKEDYFLCLHVSTRARDELETWLVSHACISPCVYTSLRGSSIWRW